MIPKAQGTIKKLDFIKFINFCASKTTKKVKRQSTAWEKILQAIYFIRVKNSEYVKNFYNSTVAGQKRSCFKN
jgi:hypothetical protein